MREGKIMDQLLKKARTGLDALVEGGAEQAVSSVSREVVREINAEMGEFTLYRTLFKDSVNFMAIRDKKRGLSAQNDVTEEAIVKGAKLCLEAAEAADEDEAWQLAPKLPKQSFTTGPLFCDEEKLLSRSQELLDDIKEQFPNIMVEALYATHSLKEGVALFSTGSEFQSTRGAYSIDLMFNAQEGKKTSSFYGSYALLDSLDEAFIKQGSIHYDLEFVSGQVHTQPAGEKYEGVILMTPSCLGSFLYSILGNFVSDSVILDGTSIWRDKLGQPVADPRFSLAIAPLSRGMVMGERFTLEGYLSEDYHVIRDGVLEKFAISDYTARKTGRDRAPNNAFDNFVVEAGDTPLDEIIRGIDKGILVGRFSGGNPGTSGDFSGVAKNTYLIENGEIKHALNETMVSGNLVQLLTNIRAISKEVIEDGSSVLPWIAFNDVIISGK